MTEPGNGAGVLSRQSLFAWPAGFHALKAGLWNPQTPPPRAPCPLPPLLPGLPSVNPRPDGPYEGGRSRQGFRACSGQPLGQPLGAQHPIIIPPPSNRNYKHFVSTPVCPSSCAEGERLRSAEADSLPITPAAAIPHAATCNLPPRVTSGEAIPPSPEEVPSGSVAESSCETHWK